MIFKLPVRTIKRSLEQFQIVSLHLKYCIPAHTYCVLSGNMQVYVLGHQVRRLIFDDKNFDKKLPKGVPEEVKALLQAMRAEDPNGRESYDRLAELFLAAIESNLDSLQTVGEDDEEEEFRQLDDYYEYPGMRVSRLCRSKSIPMTKGFQIYLI